MHSCLLAARDQTATEGGMIMMRLTFTSSALGIFQTVFLLT